MRVFTGILGVCFVILAFTMTSWRWKFEQRERPPNLLVRLTVFIAGFVQIVWFFRWPF